MIAKDNAMLEMLIRNLEASMDALAGALASNHEVVLHNLTTPEHSVIKIINGHVSGRVKGSSLLSGPDKDDGFAGLLNKGHKNSEPMIIKDYRTTTESGKILSSASTIYYSEAGEPLIAFCINVDTSAYDYLRRGLEGLTNKVFSENENQDLSLGDIIEKTVQEIIEKHSVANKKIQKSQRLKIVSEMHMRGIFKMKGGVQYAAKALGVTRYTVYNDLELLGET